MKYLKELGFQYGILFIQKRFSFFVSPKIAECIINNTEIEDLEIMAITFTFLGDRYKTIIDREFANKYYIEDEDVFDLETNHKEELFFELQPIPYSLFMNFISKNNIHWQQVMFQLCC